MAEPVTPPKVTPDAIYSGRVAIPPRADVPDLRACLAAGISPHDPKAPRYNGQPLEPLAREVSS